MKGTAHTLNVLALCAGVGGLELGLKRAYPAARVVCYVEREAFCAAVLVARMASQTLDQAPVWDDLASFDARPWRDVVDCVTAGFPCQPWSTAGKRLGTADPRHLWPHIARVVREVGPGIVFLENVPALISGGGLWRVLGSLAELGFNAEWGVFSCAAIGAPHIRKRVFILAHARGPELPRRQVQPARQELQTPPGGRQEVGRGPWPPGPDGDWSTVDPNLCPEVESEVRRVAYGSAAKLDPSFRTDRLRAIGNSVSPPVAAAAWRELATRAYGLPEYSVVDGDERVRWLDPSVDFTFQVFHSEADDIPVFFWNRKGDWEHSVRFERGACRPAHRWLDS